MRIPLIPHPNLFKTTTTISIDSPISFINQEPFLIELQGSLTLPTNSSGDSNNNNMTAVKVGNIDFINPNKPILTIAHHRLEGKLVTLTEPYALLKSTPRPSTPSTLEPPSKRIRLSSPPSSSASNRPLTHHLTSSPERPAEPLLNELSLLEQEALAPLIEIVAIVRRKIVFSKRPEPMVTTAADSSEDEDEVVEGGVVTVEDTDAAVAVEGGIEITDVIEEGKAEGGKEASDVIEEGNISVS